MADITVPSHGKLAALYAMRPNGFKGSGLNDLTWGTGSTAADLTLYEVVIDGVGTGTGGADTFKWRVNGGAWTETVDITGAEQTLADGQKLTIAATTGHTAGDQWVIGNLKDEATTVNGSVAQITDAAARLLNPNATLVWTPTNAVQLLSVNYTTGSATFSGAPGVTTVTGNNGFISSGALQKVGYLKGWSLNLSLDMADATPCGQAWKTALPGQAGGSGSANAYFVATETLWRCFNESVSGNKYFLAELFTYDPDQDQTGSHIWAWVTFNGFSLSPSIGAVVEDSVNFQVQGEISYVANA